ncbi:Zinc finger, RING/FYVE/PHD-type [Metarhizium album ARSEF 1941]|uniref:Zinc finger, RING/FYVE/PHD-type n=1 Tax=Metarhizium album (strain ARSEF 1941) TaxID=1081103 RepID=A0A0B2WYC2_METAS|nr:Zinc finger, RING/FYVE/PHD-type [Metarhizium album ARSEF 1941]KHN99058.1 Zinc finger, RING/FYVE/PHD-type [Metarhizium album ARSEF 1941]
MPSPNHQEDASPPSGSNGGSVAVGIVLGILAGIFVVLILCSRFLCKHRGASSPEDVEAGKRKRVASLLKLDGVAPSRAYGNEQEKDKKPEPPTTSRSCSFDDVISCVICLDILQGEDMVRQLPCRHYFHSSCLDTWYLRQHSTCPLCKTPFFPESKSEEPKAAASAESSRRAASSQSP